MQERKTKKQLDMTARGKEINKKENKPTHNQVVKLVPGVAFVLFLLISYHAPLSSCFS